MSTWGELLHKAVLLTSGVDALKADMKRVSQLLMDLNDRVIRLEGAGELVAEKAKNAALLGAQALSTELLKEVYSMRPA